MASIKTTVDGQNNLAIHRGDGEFCCNYRAFRTIEEAKTWLGIATK